MIGVYRLKYSSPLEAEQKTKIKALSHTITRVQLCTVTVMCKAPPAGTLAASNRLFYEASYSNCKAWASRSACCEGTSLAMTHESGFAFTSGEARLASCPRPLTVLCGAAPSRDFGSLRRRGLRQRARLQRSSAIA